MRSKRNPIERALVIGNCWRPKEIAASADVHLSTVYRHLKDMISQHKVLPLPDLTKPKGDLYIPTATYQWEVRWRHFTWDEPPTAFPGLAGLLTTNYMEVGSGS